MTLGKVRSATNFNLISLHEKEKKTCEYMWDLKQYKYFYLRPNKETVDTTFKTHAAFLHFATTEGSIPEDLQ